MNFIYAHLDHAIVQRDLDMIFLTRRAKDTGTHPRRHDRALDDIASIQREARVSGSGRAAAWPMLLLRTPKGWTGPKIVDGQPVEGTWRTHQVSLAAVREKPEHLARLQE